LETCCDTDGSLNTVKLSSLDAKDFDCVFFAGGHGTMFDFPGNSDVNSFTIAMWESGKVVSAVCHGPAALTEIKLSNGDFLVKGRKVTGFTNDEEGVMKLTE